MGKAHLAQLITTLGPRTADELGPILPHEHVFVDLRTWDQPGYAEADAADVIALMAPEIERIKALGFTALVECSTVGVGRRADIDRAVSEATGFPIVVPTGVYREPWVPPFAHAASEAALEDWMLSELEEGIERERRACRLDQAQRRRRRDHRDGGEDPPGGGARRGEDRRGDRQPHHPRQRGHGTARDRRGIAAIPRAASSRSTPRRSRTSRCISPSPGAGRGSSTTGSAAGARTRPTWRTSTACSTRGSGTSCSSATTAAGMIRRSPGAARRGPTPT